MNAFFSTILSLIDKLRSPAWTIYRDVAYGEWPEQKADIYLLNRGVHPVVIMIHGGGWSSGDKAAYAGRAKRYALAGFHVIAVNYRLATISDYRTWWPAQLDDVREVIRWVRRNAMSWRIDPRRIGVCGDSAGGHLALMLGTTDDKPTCILDMYGPTNLGAPGICPLIEALPLFGGRTYADFPKVYLDASPLAQATAFFPPTMIMQGVSDTTVPPSQSADMAARLTSLRVDCKLEMFSGGHDTSKMSTSEQVEIEMKGLKWFISRIG
jgi:acetyl esterase/lipase